MSIGDARDALLADAHEEARRALADAEEQARAQIEEARRQATEMVARARAEGEADGRLAAARDASQARTQARTEVLAAQREAYEELGRRARAAGLALRDDPGYPGLLERLGAAARRDLGDGAELEVDPPDAGGIRATAGSHRVDYTLTVLADRCVTVLGPEAARIWA